MFGAIEAGFSTLLAQEEVIPLTTLFFLVSKAADLCSPWESSMKLLVNTKRYLEVTA